MASIKLHVFAGHDDGSADCDYRGARRIGKSEGDEHRTIAEVDPAPDDLVMLVLRDGPAVNGADGRLSDFARRIGLDLSIAASLLHKALGGDGSATVFGLRIGVWDD